MNFQEEIDKWMLECFGATIAADKKERNHRFFEEATELVQAAGMTRDEALQLIDYTYGRPVGELTQEVGGVLVTLSALCSAHGYDMDTCGDLEKHRIWTMVEKIRAKQAAKPKFGPLPEESPTYTRGMNALVSSTPTTETGGTTHPEAVVFQWKPDALGARWLEVSRSEYVTAKNKGEKVRQLAEITGAE